MAVNTIDGAQLQEVLAAGATRLARLRQNIDGLNVFPVPDGDTGTNMYLTFIAALQEIGTVKGPSISAVAEAAARGALSGARGNSGVILSQLLHGFAASLAGKDIATTYDIACALQQAAETAYRSVGQPVEGTILTVARRAAEAAVYASSRTCDLRRLSLYTYKHAIQALNETPDLLPVLKEAGVVDAGGKGFVVIFEGIVQTFRNRVSSGELLDAAPDFGVEQPELVPAAEYHGNIEFAYCTEFIVKGSDLVPDTLRSELTGLGDCLMVVGTPDTLKVHIHTNHPGTVLETGLRHGALINIQVNNMREQHARLQQNKKPIGIVAVALGEGIIGIMDSMGTDAVVSGGQTMNPSTEEIVRAAESVPSDNVIVLPNNKNVILAALQAKQIAKKNIEVIPTTTIPQGLAALLAYNPEESLAANVERMQEAAAVVKTGEVTRAVRDAAFNGLQIAAGEYLGIAEGNLFTGSTLLDAVRQVVNSLATGADLVTLYYGSEVTEAEAQNIIQTLQDEMPELEFELYYGGQPLYHFIISLE
ncbi:MAG: DAK2 domain-containing protein [Bacillota bacterium]